MNASTILTNVAVLLLVATMWHDLRRSERLTPAPRTWLMVAAIFAVVSVILNWIYH